MKKLGKKAISPLVATVLLVAFAVSLGAVVMSWAKGVEATESEEPEVADGCVVKTMPSEPLKLLQVKYLRGEITKEKYFEQEKSLSSGS